jgi:hypothetical protein
VKNSYRETPPEWFGSVKNSPKDSEGEKIILAKSHRDDSEGENFTEIIPKVKNHSREIPLR